MCKKRHFLAILPCCVVLINKAFASPDTAKENRRVNYVAPLEDARFFLSADYLYWKTYETGLNFVLSNVTLSDVSASNGAKGTPQSASFDATSGGRITFGYCFAPEYWELEAGYTYFAPKGLDAYAATATAALIATYYQNTLQTIQTAVSDIQLRYQAARILAARRFRVQEHLLARFVIGVAGAWLRQDWQYSYAGSQTNFGITEYNQWWKFKGVGLEAGIELDVLAYRGLGLTTKFHGMMMYGHYHHEFVANSIFPAFPSYPVQADANTKYNNSRIVPQFQMSIGPSWSQPLGGNCYLNLFAAWELNCFWNLQETNRSIATTGFYSKDSRHTTGLISMQGLSFQVGVSF